MSTEKYTKLWSKISEETVTHQQHQASVRKLFQTRNSELVCRVLRNNFLEPLSDHPCELSEELKGELRNLVAEIDTARTSQYISNFKDTEQLSVFFDTALIHQEKERLQKQAQEQQQQLDDEEPNPRDPQEPSSISSPTPLELSKAHGRSFSPIPVQQQFKKLAQSLPAVSSNSNSHNNNPKVLPKPSRVRSVKFTSPSANNTMSSGATDLSYTITVGDKDGEYNSNSKTGLDHQYLEVCAAQALKDNSSVLVDAEFCVNFSEGERSSWYLWTGTVSRDKKKNITVQWGPRNPGFAGLIPSTQDKTAALVAFFPHKDVHYKRVVFYGTIADTKVSGSRSASNPAINRHNNTPPAVGAASSSSATKNNNNNNNQNDDDDDDNDNGNYNNNNGRDSNNFSRNQSFARSEAPTRMMSASPTGTMMRLGEVTAGNNNNNNNNSITQQRMVIPMLMRGRSMLEMSNWQDWGAVCAPLGKREISMEFDLLLRDLEVGQDFCNKAPHLMLARSNIENSLFLWSTLQDPRDESSDMVACLVELVGMNLIELSKHITNYKSPGQHVDNKRYYSTFAHTAQNPFAAVGDVCLVKNKNNNNNSLGSYQKKVGNYNKNNNNKDKYPPEAKGLCHKCIDNNKGIIDGTIQKWSFEAGCPVHGGGKKSGNARATGKL